MRSITWSQPAHDDLRKIALALRESTAPETALLHLKAIRARCAALQEFPRRGPQIGYDERKLTITGTPYIMLYRLVGDDIQIIRIFHNRADWRRT